MQCLTITGKLMSWYRKILFQMMYLRKPRWDTGITPPEVMAFTEDHAPGRALDMGCGTGTNAITLAQHGWQVVGIDFIGSAIRQAKRKARQAGVKIDLRKGDVTRLNGINGQFDLVLDIGCFHNLMSEGKRTYAQNLTHLLAPGGTFLLYAFFRTTDSSNGLLPEDSELLATYLKLVERQDGTERGQRPSAWFTFTKPAR